MKSKILAVLLGLIIFFSFILQSTFFKLISFGGISPNLLMICMTSIAIMNGEKAGIESGFFCGILEDIFFGSVLGLHALIYMCMGYFLGKFSRIFYPEDLKLPISLIALSDITYGMVCYVLFYLLRGRFHFSFYLWRVILPEMIYTILVSIILYPFILFLYKKLGTDDSRSDTDFA